MKIAFPTQQNFGLKSPLFNHFGSAIFFVIADTESDSIETVTNPDRDHDHGQCQPLKALNGKPVDAIVVGGIGKGALQKLQACQYQGIPGGRRQRFGKFRTDQIRQTD